VTLGTSTIDPVPTGFAVGPDGAFYLGQLTGAPFPVGGARIYRVPANGGTPTVVATGFTTIIDIAFDLQRNAAYVLEHDSDGIIPPTGPGLDGRLIRININTGAQTVLASTGLVKPGGVAVGADGAVYVTRRAGLAGLGDVVRIVP
jgi:sugar lactone lactonase YvrE